MDSDGIVSDRHGHGEQVHGQLESPLTTCTQSKQLLLGLLIKKLLCPPPREGGWGQHLTIPS